MIRYALVCAKGDEFEGWFRNSADFDALSEEKRLECPVCGEADVRKAPMAPAIARRREREVTLAEVAGRVREHVRENFAYVGERFAEEARAMHEGAAETRPIWGEATPEEARALIEEGAPVAPLPAPFAPTPPRKLN